MSKALIIGNGPTRKVYDLVGYKSTTYGCNALYRDFYPTYLVAIDEPIIKEILDNVPAEYKPNVLIPPNFQRFESLEYSKAHRRNNAGMVAMQYAIDAGHTHLECIGFDFLIADREASVDNVYSGSTCYENKATVNDNVGRLNYLKWFCKQNPEVQFEFIFPTVHQGGLFYDLSVHGVDNFLISLAETI